MFCDVVDYVTCCTKRVFLNSDYINQYKKIATHKAKANKRCTGNTRNLGGSEENIFLETMTLKCKSVNTVKGQMQMILKG